MNRKSRRRPTFTWHNQASSQKTFHLVNNA
jgi:hypothetical protein